jgi:type 2 lantibiotic biosynthesis protein LanM
MNTILQKTTLKQSVILESMTVPERIALFKKEPHAFRNNEEKATARILQWKHCLGVEECDSIDLRFEDLGIAEADISLILGDFSSHAYENLQTPTWWSICEAVHREPSIEEDTLPQDGFLSNKDEDQIPFEHALAAWVRVGNQRLHAELSTIDSIIGEEILRKEQRGLLENLCMLARSTMIHSFNFNKIGGYSGNDFVTGLLSPKPPNTIYKKTIFETCKNGHEELMRSKPALARLLATRVEFWVRTLVEFATHLEEDRTELEKLFNEGKELGKLIKGGRGVSDSHNGGRAVAVCTFESGTKVVYKPRNMSVDAAWINIVNAFNENVEEALHLTPLKVLSKEAHGWMEFADRQPCNNEQAVVQYYNRMGALLALVHALQGNDFHLENIVAHGAHPVAIDLETISVPEPLVDEDKFETDIAITQISKSVLRTLLLPSVMAMGGRNGVKNLGAVGVEVKGGMGLKKYQKLMNVNTDFQRWMILQGENPTQSLQNESKVELQDGTFVNPNKHRSEVANGYTKAYESIIANKDVWLSDDGPLSALRASWVRVLNRATNVYYRLLLETCNDGLVVSGVERWIHGERFLVNTLSNSANVNQTIRQIGLSLATTEQEAMLRGDVAYFLSKGDGCDYFSPNPVSGLPEQISKAKLKLSAVDAANEQISGMGEKNLKLQKMLMQSSYLSAQLTVEKQFHGGNAPLDTIPQPDTPPQHKEVNDWILSGLEEIELLAIRQENRANWIDIALDAKTETARPSAMSVGFYSGRGGMSLLFERAYRHFGDKKWLDLAKATIQSELQVCTKSHKDNLTLFDIEGPTGMMTRPGFISAAWAIGTHEGQGIYRDLAKKLLIEVSDRTIERDTSHDVISGTAGYMLLGMHLAQQENDHAFNPLLNKLGEHLLKKAIDIDGTGWEMSPGSRPLNGFGHGRAGIGLALLQAGTMLNRSDFRKIGISAIRAEHELRSTNKEQLGWPDFRAVGIHDAIPSGPHMCAWCSGAEGIALARAASLAFADDAFLQDDLEYALACMKALPPKQRLHLCCGETGLTEAYRSIEKLTGNNLSNEISDSFSYFFVNASNGPICENQLVTGISLMQGSTGLLWAGLSEVMDDESALLLLRS